MKSVFDAAVQQELTERMTSLTPTSKALWGKMNLSQMLRHGALCDDMYLGRLPVKRVLIGRLIGKFVLKQVLKDEEPFRKNSPTSPSLQTPVDEGDFNLLREAWLTRIREYNQFNNPRFIHPFFGPMTKEQIGYVAYKHADHHLRQFGV